MSKNSGAAFIAVAARNLESDASCPVRLYTSFNDFGCFIEMMAWHFSRLASIPRLVNHEAKEFSGFDCESALRRVESHLVFPEFAENLLQVWDEVFFSLCLDEHVIHVYF
ncbi:hypothetical protein PIB30_073530 [Stylosanthes scabra]|uniref:Uncharacterized protein n=1 Tax=Stylosanthes scabra TaxID=79078 RepID=A0ABU6SPI1_9FABA|nr:hypothetical protein [Stylosanthes scabra]